MRRLLFFLLALSAASAFGQAKTWNVKIRPPRPKVGVVLSGGGAKGAAHIGVLKYLEEIGIPVDYVAGTSMGSIIGGLYAMGYSPDELATLIAEMNWSQYVGNSLDRNTMSQENRQRHSTMVVNIPFSLEGILKKATTHSPISFMPNAYVNNTLLINLFNSLCVGYQKEMDFNDLPIPFACVATDINTGEEVVIRHGSVPDAMRASMAIPGVFAPVRMDGHTLVDGGLVNNFPVDVIREMGADIVIGVDVPSKSTVDEEKEISLPEVFSKLIGNATSSKRESNRLQCNIYMTPDISGFGTLSFSHEAIDTLVSRGYHEAMTYHDPLMQLKHALDSINGEPINKQLRADKAKNLADAPVFINNIVINQTEFLSPEWLLRKGELEVGTYMTEKEINHAIDLLRGTGAFDAITYHITENGNDSLDAYKLTMVLKPTQPHLFGLGVRYDTEEGTSMLLNVGLNEKRLSGFKLNIGARLSYNPKINVTGTYTSFNFANFSLGYQYRNQHYMLLLSDGYSNISYLQHRVSAYVSQFQKRDMQLSFGLTYTSTMFEKSGLFDFSINSYDNSLFSNTHHVSNRLFEPFFRVQYDNCDSHYFARHGVNMTVGSHVYLDLSDATSSTGDLSFSFQGYFTPGDGKFTIIPQLYTRCIAEKPEYANLWNVVGGELAERHTEYQIPFIGQPHADEVSDWATVLRCDLRYNIYGNHYLTATYNYLYGCNPFGNVHEDDSNEHYSGIGLRYSYDSFIGPITLSGQWSNIKKQFSGYLSIGYVF